MLSSSYGMMISWYGMMGSKNGISISAQTLDADRPTPDDEFGSAARMRAAAACALRQARARVRERSAMSAVSALAAGWRPPAAGLAPGLARAGAGAAPWRRMLSESKAEAGEAKTVSLHSVQELHRTVAGMVDSVRVKLEGRGVRDKVAELAKELAREDLWDDPDRAGKLSREHAALAEMVENLDVFTTSMDNALEMAAMASEEGETQVVADCLAELEQIHKQVQRFHLNMLLDHPADRLGCLIELSAGAGGTESCDWTEMLLEMYKRWAEQTGYQATVTDTSPGTEAGLRSAVLQISGLNAYGWAKAETGVHRMVRISEYDSNGRRQTCFAQVSVLPLMDDEDNNLIELDPADLKIDTYRASGAGGQHVNTTESAVRVTHIPTGVVAQCQAERSQHRNKAMALSVLRSRLLERKLQAERDARREQRNSLGENSWGNQIRSYVLHPYKLVKDHRTNHETPQALAVLKGEPDFLTPFMEAYLAQAAADDNDGSA